MHTEPIRPASGHIFRVQRQRGAQWYAKFRLPDGRQVQKRLGPAWSGRGRPPTGYLTKQGSERELRRLLSDADRGTLAGMGKTGATVSDAAAEWLRHREHERGLKPSTLAGYRQASVASVPSGSSSQEHPSVGSRLVGRGRASS
jgi:hypothetical protein